jgi:small-conductance mechanosensitive channel
VSYESNIEQVLPLLEDLAQAHPRVLQNPKPAALVTSFGDSGINLGLYVWISDPERGKALVCSDIYREVWRNFQQQGIEIPYPQQEVRVRGNVPLQNPHAEPKENP